MEICNPMLQSKQTHILNVPYEMLQAFFLYLFVILVKQIKYTYFIIKLRFPISNNRCCRLKLIYVFIKNILHWTLNILNQLHIILSIMSHYLYMIILSPYRWLQSLQNFRSMLLLSLLMARHQVAWRHETSLKRCVTFLTCNCDKQAAVNFSTLFNHSGEKTSYLSMRH